MMATTHALFGVVLASALLRVAPEFAPVALIGAVLGSVFPDFDLYAGHRRTLHFPVYYAVAVVPTMALVFVVPSSATVALAVFVLGAAAHSLMDVFGGGLELRPWRATSERAVYDHYRGRWVPPRRWVRYDGAPEDFLLGAILAVPTLVVADDSVRALVGGLLLVSAGYALFRKRLASLAARLAATIPEGARSHLPERFQPAERSAPPRGETGN